MSDAPVRNAPVAPASFLSADLLFEGTISGEGELHVEGAVRGEINVARLVVGDKAHIEGVVRGGSIDVRGRVVGNIEAKSIKLYETAYVEGDITHEQLSIDVGSYFQGHCRRLLPSAAPANDSTERSLISTVSAPAGRSGSRKYGPKP